MSRMRSWSQRSESGLKCSKNGFMCALSTATAPTALAAAAVGMANRRLRWGSFKPNAFGLFDMLGNVWEWTCSAYTKSYEGSEQECAVSARKYSLRGGSWNSFPWGVRAAYRGFYDLPGSRGFNFGFRLARDN